VRANGVAGQRQAGEFQGGLSVIFGLIGQAAIRALLAVVCMSLVVNAVAIRTGRSPWRTWGRWSMVAQFAVAGIASGCLVWLLVTGNNWYAYVAEYTGPGLALIYRIAAFWGGNAGSLLFWVLVLTLYGAVVAFSKHDDSERMLPWVQLILSSITLFYSLVLNFLTTPFLRLDHPLPASGLNPLLQNPGMTVHPVNVYLGFIGFSVPYAYAMTSLILNKTDATWLVVTRRWTLVSWLFLSIGIVYGAHWSYEELGWGGYWAWDPVENASLLPWLTATAFLHSAIVQEKKGLLKTWNVVLVTLTFLLTVLGTFLTRSGVLWSIHAFANAPLGRYFLAFLCVTTVFSLAVLVWRRRVLRSSGRIESVVSKESAFLLNNVLFVGSAFAVLWGTVFPLVSQAVTGHKIMVDSPFYNAVNLPLAICILLLMGIGPLVAWRKSAVHSVLSSILYPLLAATILGLAAAGVLYFAYGHKSSLGTLGLIGALFVVLTVFIEFYLSVRARVLLTQDSAWRSACVLVRRNRRRYGGYIVHLAVAVIAIGIAASGAFHTDLQTQMKPGGPPVHIGGYEITFDGMGVADQGPDKRMYANLIVERGGRTLGVLQPAVTFYANGQSPTTNVALYSRPLRDLYAVMLGTVGGDTAVFDFHVNPLVEFIWYGGYLLIVGTLLSLWPESRRTRAAASADPVDQVLQQLTELEYDFNMGKLDLAEYRQSRAELERQLRDAERLQAEVRERVRREVEELLAGARTVSAEGEAK
jgi:cytochrome c-type biogenesis protein CcmF